MEDNSNIRKEMEGLSAHTLSGMKKRTPFEVPEGYFESLPHMIQEKCVESTREKSLWDNVLHFLFAKKYAFAVACVCVLSITGALYRTSTMVDHKEDTVIGYYVSELDESTLEESIALTDDDDQDAKAAKEYLIDQNIDPSILVE